MPPRRSIHITTEIFRTELNLNGAGGFVAGKRYITVRMFILKKCNEWNVLSWKQSGDNLLNEVRAEVVGHTTLQAFEAKFNSPRNGPYWAFHNYLDALVMGVLKKTAESRRNARLNPDTEGEEEPAGDGDASREESAVACP